MWLCQEAHLFPSSVFKMLMLTSKVYVLKCPKPEVHEGELFYYSSADSISMPRQNGRLLLALLLIFATSASF